MDTQTDGCENSISPQSLRGVFCLLGGGGGGGGYNKAVSTASCPASAFTTSKCRNSVKNEIKGKVY